MKKTVVEEKVGLFGVESKIKSVTTHGVISASKYRGFYIDNESLTDIIDTLGYEDGDNVGFGRVTVTIEVMEFDNDNVC